MENSIIDLRQMLDFAVEKYGDQAAYLHKDNPKGKYRPISFREFKEDITNLGEGLLLRGCRDQHVGIIGENRYEWIVSDLAVACGLGVSVPLDKELPSNELAALIKRAELKFLIHSEKLYPKVKEALAVLSEEGVDSPELFCMDGDIFEDSVSLDSVITEGEILRSRGRYEYSSLPLDPDEMRFLLFTSGTSGLAKGVMLSHRNFVSNVINTAYFVNLDRLESKKIGLSVLPMHHTYEFSASILGSIYQGGTIAFCDGLRYIVKNIEEAGVTYMLVVPLIIESLYKRIMKNADKQGKGEKLRAAIKFAKAFKYFDKRNYNDFQYHYVNKRDGKTSEKLFKEVRKALGGKLKLIIVGAAAVDPDVVEGFSAMGFRVVQGYGMTECAPIIALNPDYDIRYSSAGKPLVGTHLRIADPGEDGVGEIQVQSPSVMLGYYKDPAETEKVITKDGWLCTGDLGYMDKEHYVYITGRKKNVIVTKNGKNIFPEEVEDYLCRSPFIKEALVKGTYDERTEDLSVCAEIFPDYTELDKGLSSEEIYGLLDGEIDRINLKMPSYKRVRHFTVRETEFEKTTTQKIKRW